MMKNYWIVIFLLMLMLLNCCGQTNNEQINQQTNTETTDLKLSSEQIFINNATKCIKTLDLACFVTYSVLGDLYKLGKISEEKKNELINVGTGIALSLDLSKKSLAAYSKAIDTGISSETDYKQVIFSLSESIKIYRTVSGDVENYYYSVTGAKISLPDLYLFSDVLNYLNK